MDPTLNWPHCPTAQHSDQTHPAPNPQFTLCNLPAAILMATAGWHGNLRPTSYSSGSAGGSLWIADKTSRLWRNLAFPGVRSGKAGTHARRWPVPPRGRRELCYSEARLSHWCGGTPQRGKPPAFVPARAHRVTRREAGPDGQPGQKIPRGDHQRSKRKRRVDSELHSDSRYY